MKKNILFILISSFLVTGLNANKTELEKNLENTSNSDVSKILENNQKLDKENFFLNYYQSRSSDGRVKINDDFVLNEPLSMGDVAKLNHPYYQKKLKYIKEKGLSNIGEELNLENFNKLRNDSIYNEAVKVGIQSGLYKILYKFKNTTLKDIETQLDVIFDFSELVLAEGRVKPPVIIDASSSLSKENKYKLRTSDASFEIYEQAEVILRPPSYLDYLHFEVIKPKKPETLLLPINDEETAIWENGVKEGWILGIRQGKSIIKEGFASLLRDFYGMNVFHIMNDSKIINTPMYEKINIGTTTNGKNLKLGEATFRVSVLPEFNSNTQAWKAIPKISDFLEKRNK